MTTGEYKRTSSKGFRGWTIIFTNARARCHTIADALGAGRRPETGGAAAGAGEANGERNEVREVLWVEGVALTKIFPH